MTNSSHGPCKISPNQFCLHCGNYFKKGRGRPAQKLRPLFEEYYGTPLPKPDWFVPSNVCQKCRANIYLVTDKTRDKLPEEGFVLWNEPESVSDCYFCQSTPAKGRSPAVLANVASLTRIKRHGTRDAHSSSGPPTAPLKRSHDDDGTDPTYDLEVRPPQNKRKKIKKAQKLTEKDCLLLCGSQPKHQIQSTTKLLKDRGLTKGKVRSSAVRIESRKYEKFFSYDSRSNFVYCKDIMELGSALDPDFQPENYRLFADANKKFLSVCLLHNSNEKKTIPVAISRNKKENYARMRRLFNLINYPLFKFKFVGDIKMLWIVRGMTLGRSTYSCLFCHWDSYEERKFPYASDSWDSRHNSRLGKHQTFHVCGNF